MCATPVRTLSEVQLECKGSDQHPYEALRGWSILEFSYTSPLCELMFDGRHQLIHQSEAVSPQNQIRGKKKGKPPWKSERFYRHLAPSHSTPEPSTTPTHQLNNFTLPAHTLRTSKQAREPQSTSTAPAEKTPNSSIHN